MDDQQDVTLQKNGITGLSLLTHFPSSSASSQLLNHTVGLSQVPPSLSYKDSLGGGFHTVTEGTNVVV